MVIEKGGEWGTAVEVDSPLAAAGDAAVVDMQSRGVPFATAGNLHRSLGEPVMHGPGQYTRLPVDALVCVVTGPDGSREEMACADVTVGSWFSRSGLVVITNVGLWRGLDLTPGSHPNDGRFEVLALDAAMPVRQRLLARRRARTGAHLPHPCLSRTTRTELTIARRGRQRLSVDSVDAGSWTSVRVMIATDRLAVLV
ncbi:MAG: hypothetical protein ACO36A_01780 [Ilumatobacteraceae bacterium]